MVCSFMSVKCAWYDTILQILIYWNEESYSAVAFYTVGQNWKKQNKNESLLQCSSLHIAQVSRAHNSTL